MIGLCHLGMHAKNPASLAEFYRDVMGLQIVGCSDASHPLGASAFASLYIWRTCLNSLLLIMPALELGLSRRL
jgi:hypothetical protein